MQYDSILNSESKDSMDIMDMGKDEPAKRRKSWDNPQPEERSSRSVEVIAYGNDGSTIIFESLKEAADFFGLKRVDTLRRYIDNDWPMPDGTTFCDYLL